MRREVNADLSGGELKRGNSFSLSRQCQLAIFDEPEAGIDLWSLNVCCHFQENETKGCQYSYYFASGKNFTIS